MEIQEAMDTQIPARIRAQKKILTAISNPRLTTQSMPEPLLALSQLSKPIALEEQEILVELRGPIPQTKLSLSEFLQELLPLAFEKLQATAMDRTPSNG
jgi:hypothetical protein